MSKNKKSTHDHHHFYAKRLNTQSFAEPELKEEFAGLTDKLERQIQVVKKNLRVKNLKMIKAKEKLKTINSQEKQLRETIRDNIDKKTRLTQSNLQKIMLEKRSRSKSILKFRDPTLSRIRSNQKNEMESAFRKSQMYRKQSEKYLNQKSRTSQISKVTSYSQIHHKTGFQDTRSSNINNEQQRMKSRQKLLPKVLKVSDRLLHTKQSRKSSLEESKQAKNLYEYISKLQSIESRRNTKVLVKKDTIKAKEAKNKEQYQRIKTRKNELSLDQMSNKGNFGQTSQASRVSRPNHSFSELYAKKLQQKLQKKAVLEELSFRKGDMIVSQDHISRRHKKNEKIVQQTVREYEMRRNFRYMEYIKK